MSEALSSQSIGAGLEVGAVDQPIGTLGLIVLQRRTGRALGLTISAVVAPSADALLISPSTEVSLGTAQAIVADSSESQVNSCAELVVAVPIRRDFRISAHLAGALPASPPVDAIDLVGSELRLAKPGSLASARIWGLGATVSVEVPEEGARRYAGAIELIDTSNEPFAVDGDAGAAVISESGDIVGLVFGRRGDRSFIVPLGILLRDAQLAPMTVQGAVAHNTWANAWPWRRPRELVAASRAPFRPIPEGTEQLQHSIAANDLQGLVLDEILTWLIASGEKYVAANSDHDRAMAFQPLLVRRYENPAPEIVSAIRHISSDLPLRVAERMLQTLTSSLEELDPRLRAMAWQFVFSAIRSPDDGPSEFQREVYRAAAAYERMLPSQCSSLELAAMADAMFALPSSYAQTARLRSMAEWNEKFGSHYLARAFLALSRDRPSAISSLVVEQWDLVEQFLSDHRGETVQAIVSREFLATLALIAELDPDLPAEEVRGSLGLHPPEPGFRAQFTYRRSSEPQERVRHRVDAIVRELKRKRKAGASA